MGADWRGGPVPRQRTVVRANAQVTFPINEPDPDIWTPIFEPDPLLTPHAQYLALGTTPDLRQQAYRDFVGQAVTQDELDLIRRRLQRQRALGSDRFRAMIEAQLSRAAGPQKAGRPRRLLLATD